MTTTVSEVTSAVNIGTAASSAVRNLAFRRAAYHSTSINYKNTGHLVTNGIISETGMLPLNCSAQYNDSPADEEVDKAFDGEAGSKWLTGNNTAWIMAEAPSTAGPVAGYAITSANDDDTRDPKSWVVEGSDTGGSWSPIDTQTDQAFTDRLQTKRYPLSVTVKHNYYRLRVTANNGAAMLQLSEFDLWDADGNSVLRPPLMTPDFDSSWISGPKRSTPWVSIDLGAPSDISSVRIIWSDGIYATFYVIDVSADGEVWERYESNPAGIGGEETLVKETSGIRYIKLICHEGPGNLFGVKEIEVYGTNQLPPYTLPPAPLPQSDGTQYLTGGNWRLARASEVTACGSELSTEGFDDTGWLPAVVPGTVLTSYLEAGAIPDMNVADNQLQISDSFFTADFWYRNTFIIHDGQWGRRVWLNFNSINWKADIFLNGTRIGRIDGAFIRGRFDITDAVICGGSNYLAVHIHKNDTPGSVTVQTKEDAGPNGGVLGADNPTIHASIGWDWIPTIRGRNIGIYGDVFVTYTDDILLIDPWVAVDLDIVNKDEPTAALSVRSTVLNPSGKDVTATVHGVINPGNITFVSAPITLTAGERREVELHTVTMRNPKLWWPNTYGDQFLYDCTLTAQIRGTAADVKSFRFGVREFTYSSGTPLMIYCNSVRITCRGGNWGMDDANLTNTAVDYDVKVRLHAEANLTMIRNWVGMTNHQAFYEACDRYGILIWDDFWLANPGDGLEPRDEVMFMANAVDKITRNRRHAALALYCGRNEGSPPEILNAALEQAVKAHDGTRAYIPHSADGVVSGFGPYSVQTPKYYFSSTPVTLHSERGMPNVPSYESLMAMLTPAHAWPMDSVWGLHDFCGGSAMNCDGFEDQMKKYAAYNSLREFAGVAQMVNYDNHKAMFEAVYVCRGNGLLMWMSQPAWPSMVWQTYDYYYDTNAGYFGVKKGNQPINAIYVPNTCTVWTVNATGTARQGVRTAVKVYSLSGAELMAQEKKVDLAAGGADDSFSLNGLSAHPGFTPICFVVTEVYHNGERIAENFTWDNLMNDQDYAALSTLPEVTLKTACRRLEDVGSNPVYAVKLTNRSSAPALMIRVKTLDAATGERMLPVYYSDNYVSLMPGESTVITLEIDSRFSTGTPTFSVEGWNVAGTGITGIEAWSILSLTPEEGLL